MSTVKAAIPGVENPQYNKLFFVLLNIFGSAARKLLHVGILTCRTLRMLQEFYKTCAPLCYNFILEWLFYVTLATEICKFAKQLKKNFRLPARFKWDLRPSAMLRSVFWWLFIEVSKQRIRPIFRGQAAQLNLEDWTDMLSRNFGKYLPINVGQNFKRAKSWA